MIGVANKLAKQPLALTTPSAATDAPTCLLAVPRTHTTYDCSRPNTSVDYFAQFCPFTLKAASLLHKQSCSSHGCLNVVTVVQHALCVPALRTSSRDVSLSHVCPILHKAVVCLQYTTAIHSYMEIAEQFSNCKHFLRNFTS
jgi:hypothetical protein